MIRLSKEQVILLHKRLIETTGGSNGIIFGANKLINGMLEYCL